MSVSGHEIPLQKEVIKEMTPYCDKIVTDYTGNVISILNPDAKFKVMLAGHIDEVGLVAERDLLQHLYLCLFAICIRQVKFAIWMILKMRLNC